MAAISRLSRLAAPNNPEFTYDALEYERPQGIDSASLSADLHNNIPNILEEPGHFIVAKGTQGSTFTINDPYYDRHLLTDSYSNTFLTAGKYIPSHTDLSYLLFTGPQDISFDLKTATESGLGQQFIQNPLTSESNPSQTSGQPVRLLYLQYPSTEKYQLVISSINPSIYNASAFTYDAKGNVRRFDLQGITDNSHSNTFILSYDKTNQTSEVVQKQVTVPLLVFDLNTLYAKGMIKKGSYILLSHLFSDIQKALSKNREWEAKILLKTALLLLNIQKPFSISQQAYNLLSQDISSLLQH